MSLGTSAHRPRASASTGCGVAARQRCCGRLLIHERGFHDQCHFWRIEFLEGAASDPPPPQPIQGTAFWPPATDLQARRRGFGDEPSLNITAAMPFRRRVLGSAASSLPTMQLTSRPYPPRPQRTSTPMKLRNLLIAAVGLTMAA